MTDRRVTRLGGPVGPKLTGRSAARDTGILSPEDTVSARAEETGLALESRNLAEVRGAIIAKGITSGKSDTSTARMLGRAENLFTGGGDYGSVIATDRRSAMQRSNDLSRAAFTYKYAPEGGYNGSKDDQWNAVSRARQDVMDYSGGVKLARGTFEASRLNKFEGNYQDELARRNKSLAAGAEGFAKAYNSTNGAQSDAGAALTQQIEDLTTILDNYKQMDIIGSLGDIGKAGYTAAMELTSSKLSEDSVDLTGLMNFEPGDNLGPRLRKLPKSGLSYQSLGGLR